MNRILVGLAFLVVLVMSSFSTGDEVISPGSSSVVRCSSCPVCPSPSPSLAPTPIPTPAPTPVPSAAPELLLTFASSLVGANPYPTDSSALSKAATLKTYADIVVQSWYASPPQSYCNHLRASPTTVKACMPYYDFGFTFTNNISWQTFKVYQLGSAYYLYGATPTVEAVMDFANQSWVTIFKNYLTNGFSGLNMPKAGSGHNAVFFDNGFFDPTWVWTSYPISATQRKVDVKNALATIRQTYNANGDKIVMNVWSDVTATWANDPAYYRSVMDMVDYALFEKGVNNYGSGTPLSESEALHYINKAVEYNTNTKTTVLWTTEYGEFWRQFVAGLFSCTSSKCGFWQQPVMTPTQIAKTTTLKLGVPTAPYVKSGCYYRTFTKGVAVLNLTGSSCSYSLPAGSYTDWIAGGTVSSTRIIPAYGSKIYIKQ